jgi:hypothetical protein
MVDNLVAHFARSYPKNRAEQGFVVRQAHHERERTVRPEPVEGRA